MGRQQRLRNRVQMVVDALVFGLAMYVAHQLRTVWQFEVFGGSRIIGPLEQYFWLFPLVVLGGPFLLNVQGFYNRPGIPSRRLMVWQVLKACAYLTVGLMVVIFVVRQGTVIGRSVILLFGVLSMALLWVKEELWWVWWRSRLGQAQLANRVVLVGPAEDTARFRSEVVALRRGQVTVVAQLDLNERPIEALVSLMHEHSVNAVIVLAKHTYLGQIEQAIEVCEREGVEVWLLADFFKTQVSRTTVDDLYGRPTLVFRTGPEKSWPVMVKQAMDFAGSLVLLLLMAMPMVVVAALIRITSPGPVLFRQQRSGLNGQPFMMLKFRSMTTDAEQRKHELEALNEMTGPVFKVTNDPRITPLGRFLRRYSVDEWPQLINVLRGEMSLVGPRPLPVDEVRRFDDPAHRRRLSVKPGLTCLWQISGRNDLRDFAEWVRLDLEYIDNWSLWLDCKILLLTVPAVVTASGAK